MLHSKKALTYATMASDYLKNFVEKSEKVYGKKFVTLNVHNLNHIVDDVINSQSNLNDISAFPFESELGKIKSVLRSPHNTLAQYCRRLYEENQFLDQSTKIPKELEILKIKAQDQILSLRYRQQYLSCKHPNNTVLLQDGSVVKILMMFLKNDVPSLTVANYKSKSSAYKEPCNSSMLDIYEIDDKIMVSSVRIVSLESVKVKMVKLSFNYSERTEMKTFVSPLLH